MKYLPAFQAKRMIEEVGLPPAVDNLNLAKSLLLRVASWLAEPAPQKALDLILRASNYEGEEVFKSFLTRNRIASLNSTQIVSLAERLERAITHGIPKAAAALVEENKDRVFYWAERLRVAVELLSRLVLRLEGERAEQILQKALNYSTQPLFQKKPWLIPPLYNLFSRTLESLEAGRAQKYIPQFVKFPLPGADNFEPVDHKNWPDPLSMVEDRKPASPAAYLEPIVVQKLIDLVGASPTLSPRGYAAQRLAVLLGWGLLTDEEQAAFGKALWKYRASCESFPEETLFYDFAFLDLPEPEQGLADRVFRNKYLGSASHLSEDYFTNILSASKLTMSGRSSFSFSASEINLTMEKILGWWKIGAAAGQISKFPFLELFSNHEALQNVVAAVLGRVVLPRIEDTFPRLSDVAEMVENLRTIGYPMEHVYPALTRLQPERLSELAGRLRQSLASSQRKEGKVAVYTVWWWLQKAQEFNLPEPPDDLVQEIALAISLRRSSCLKQALSAAEWILLHRTDLAGQRFVELVAEGLGYLAKEARYDTRPKRDTDIGFASEDTSTVRALCARVALAAARSEKGSHPIFNEWIDLARTDPLPEVRFALQEAEATYVPPEKTQGD